MNINGIDATTPLGFLVVIIYLIFTVVNPIVKNKLKSDTAKHWDNNLATALEIAKNIVVKFSNQTSLSYSERKNEAVKELKQLAKSYKINISDEMASMIVERAYQYLKNNHLIDNHEPTREPETVKDFEGLDGEED